MNLRKCRNKSRHKWQDEGKLKDGFPSYTYVCKICGKRKIKQSSYSASYYDNEGKFISSTAPECKAVV